MKTAISSDLPDDRIDAIRSRVMYQVDADITRRGRRARKAVAALSPVDQQLYALCVDGGATYEQAAQELGVSHSVVRNRIHRLRTRLRADLSALRGTA